MKSARERAEYLWGELKSSAQDALDYDAWMLRMELQFRDHARDQIQVAADRIMALELCGECPEASTYTRDDAYNAVFFAPAPGE